MSTPGGYGGYGGHEEDRRRAAAMRSYVTPAVITMALYFLLWLPGLIANVVYWVAARNDRALTGVAPQGQGCLTVLFVVFVILPAIGLCALIGLSVAGIGIGGLIPTPGAWPEWR